MANQYAGFFNFLFIKIQNFHTQARQLLSSTIQFKPLSNTQKTQTVLTNAGFYLSNRIVDLVGPVEVSAWSTSFIIIASGWDFKARIALSCAVL